MQAMPSIPAGPQPAADTPAQSKAAPENTKGKPFGKHLSTASQKIEHSQKKSTDIAADKIHGKKDSHAVNDQGKVSTDKAEEIAGIAAGLTSGKIIIATVADSDSLSPGSIAAQQTKVAAPAPQDMKALVREMTADMSAADENVKADTGKAGQIISLHDAAQAADTQAVTGTKEEQTTISSLLAQANRAKPSPEQEIHGAAAKNNGREGLSIENWRAQFSYQHSTDASDPKTAGAPAQTEKTGVVLTRQPVLTAVAPELEQVAAPPGHGKSGSGVDIPKQPQDTNNNFIHSNLPGVSAKNDTAGNTQQQTGDSEKNSGGESLAQTGQPTVLPTGQDTPLIFSLHQDTTTGLVRPDQQTTTSLVLHLPSGLEVPHNEIVNQVVDHFTLNRRLESGSITLRLHPAELGELRMEIKVEQDNIKAHITTQNPQVQDILDRNLPRLREALAQQGMNLEHMQVTVTADDGGNNQLFQEHFGQQQFQRPSHSNGDNLSFSLHEEEEPVEKRRNEEQNLSVLV